MTDDPDQDLLPVKDNASYSISTQKLFSSLYDDVQRQCISKLPRSDIEDRYLRIYEENMQLKKHCNKQQEKIKRLATKLLREVSDRKRCAPNGARAQQEVISGNMKEQQNRILELENTNAQLQERLLVMKNQLATHSRLHSAAHGSCSCSPSRSPVGHASRPPSRSSHLPEFNKIIEMVPKVRARRKSPAREKRKMNVMCNNIDDTITKQAPVEQEAIEEDVLRNQLNMMEQHIQLLREESNSQISSLEEQLAKDKRQQVTDNVEMIRLKRGLKQQSLQLVALQAQNVATNRDVAVIQEALEQAHKENDYLHQQLLQQKQKNLDLQQEVHKIEISSETVRELQEAIVGLQEDKSTLKAHNDRLLELSASAQAVSSQQRGAREETLQQQLTEVQASLGSLLHENDDLKSMLEEDKNPVNTLRQEYNVLLAKYSDLQTQCQNLEKQMAFFQKPDALVPSTVPNSTTLRIPSLEQSRSVLNPLLTATTQPPQEQLQDMISDDGVGVTESFVPHKHSTSNLTLRSDTKQSGFETIDEGFETIDEEPLAEEAVKCGCNSPTAESCTCEEEIPSDGETPHAGDEAPPGVGGESTSIDQTDPNPNDTTAPSEHTPVDPPHVSSAVMESSVGDETQQFTPELNTDPRTYLGNKPLDCLSEVTSPRTNSKTDASISTSKLAATNPDDNMITNDDDTLCNCDKRPSHIQGCCCCSRISQSQKLGTNVTVPENLNVNVNQMPPLFNADDDGNPSASTGDIGYPIGADDLYTNLDVCYSSGEINAMAAKPTDDNFLATHLDTTRELEKCRELLRVQYNLNLLYGQELAKLKELLRNSSGIKAYSSTNFFPVQDSNIIQIRQDNKTSSENWSPLPKKRSLLCVGEGQGLFELHAGYIQLSSEGTPRLSSGNTIYLTWVFYDQDVAYTPPRLGPNTQFDCSAVYKVQVDQDFLQYIEKEKCEINLNMDTGEVSEVIARGHLAFSELLDFPQNKLHAYVQLTSTSPSEEAVSYGVLQCWYRLSCDISLIARIKNHDQVQFDSVLHIQQVSHNPSQDDTSLSVVDEGEAASGLAEQRDLAQEEGIQHQQSPAESVESVPCSIDSLSTILKQNTLKQLKSSPKSSLTTGQESSVTSVSFVLETKSDSPVANNQQKLTLFQKRMIQLRKGLHSESSNPDLDDAEQVDSSHGSSAKSEESVKIIPHVSERYLAGKIEDYSSEPQKQLEEELSEDIRRSQQGLTLANSSTRDMLEMLNAQNWQQYVHNNIDAKNEEESKEVKSSSSASRGSNENVAQTTAEPKEAPQNENNVQSNPSSSVYVEIHWMTLDPDSTPLKNPDVNLLYVEYSFLGMRGSGLETALSLTKPTTIDERLVYNYKKKFDVSLEKNVQHRAELKKLLSPSSDNHSIHFVIISEPLPEDSNNKDCVEIGKASVDIYNMLLEERDYDPISIAILSMDGCQENIGSLNISIRGVRTLKEVAAED